MELIQKLRADLKKIDQIESKFLRDLVSLLYFPSIQHPLIPDQLVFSFNTEENFETLSQWLEKNQHLISPTQKKYMPLGKYAETLLLLYLSNNKHFDLIGHSVQLYEERITLGELDYLFLEKTNKQAIHLELAVKFYLKVNWKGSEVYLGPSTKDWMKRKLDKLLSHQLQLPHLRKDLLTTHFQSFNFHSRLYLKGSLFLPFQEWCSSKLHPLNCGWWITVEKLEMILNTSGFYSIITQKSNWLFPFSSRQTLYQQQEVLKIVNQTLLGRNEIMLCRLNENKEVLDRGFVMRLNWPYEAL